MKNSSVVPKTYKHFSPRMKQITRWQATRLKAMGYKNTYISKLFGIHASTVSSWLKTRPDKDKEDLLSDKTTLCNKFGVLSSEEVEIIYHQAIHLINIGESRSRTAEILGLSSGAVISGWLNKKKRSTLSDKKILSTDSIKIKPSRSYKNNYKKLTKRLKAIIDWQITHLIQRGYDSIFISRLLCTNKNIITSRSKLYLNESHDIETTTELLTKKFGKLSLKEKNILLSQALYLENNGFHRAEIAKIIGLSSGAVISGWHQDRKRIKNNITKNQHEMLSRKNSLAFLHYRNCKKPTQYLIRLQALLLKTKGYKYSETAEYLNIHPKTLSKWWKAYINTGARPKITETSTIFSQIKLLTPEMEHILCFQITTLKNKGYPHKEIAIVLGLKNSAFVTRLLKKIIKPNINSPAMTTDHPPINIPPIGIHKTKLATNENQESIKDFPEKPINHKLTDNSDLVSSPSFINVISNDTSDSCFFQEKDNNISVKENTKIIKNKYYSQYCEARKLIDISQKKLIESKKKALDIQAEAKKTAKLLSQEMLQKAEEKAKSNANDLLAEQNISATNAATEYLATLQNSLPEIIMEIIRNFIKNYDDRDFVIHNINSAISKIENQQKIEIYINDKIINNIKKRLNEIEYAAEKIILIPDSAIKEKDCLIVTKHGIVNANLEYQIKKIEETIVFSHAN